MPKKWYARAMSNEMKKVDQTTLENLLYLSRLSPESTDMATLKKQVDEIVGYFEILSKYDDSENPYDAYPTTEAEKLREDEVVAGLEMHDVKKVNEKNFLDGYFQVPKVLGEGA
jgi:aspartyl-tRNA(Asn)/glutamyl-tRNA(Gln) amidotransferase subunit C